VEQRAVYDVVVVGAGDPAVEATLLLSSIAQMVYAVTRGRELHEDEALLERLRAKQNVETIGVSRVAEIRGEQVVESLVLEDVETKQRKELRVDGVFVEMGYVVKTGFVKGFVDLNEAGEVVTGKDCGTSRPGIFAAGDVTDIPYKQAVISAGQGATAGLSAYNYVQRLRGKPAVRTDWKTKRIR